MVDQLSCSRRKVTRVAREVGTEGKLGGQADVKGVAGTWKDLTDSVNSDGRQPDRPGAKHCRSPTAVANGDCRKKLRSMSAARFWNSRTPSTRWWTQLRSFASEVTRVAREVGSEGALGGQADVRGVAGTWKD